MGVLLHFENINRAIGDRVILGSITETIEDGEKVGVLGINGAGKSTLLSIIAGELEADSGDISARRNLRISYLSQNPVFDNSISILANVSKAISGKEEHWDIIGETKAMLLKFGIDNPEIAPEKLSGGQRKRAALMTECFLKTSHISSTKMTASELSVKTAVERLHC